MTSTRLWDRAGALPVPADGGRPRPAVAALPAQALPTVQELFTFMRDAELRFAALRMRIEERVAATPGERLEVVEVMLRHPNQAKVITTEPELGTSGNHELWISDGETVRTYASRHRLGTRRPVRRRVVGLDDPDLPGFAQVYSPVTALPMETLPEAFIHPAGFCQNVLATGHCAVVGTDVVAGREAVVLVSEHPRATERFAERPDFRIEIAVDRDTGVISRLVESVGGVTTRQAEVTALQPDAPLPPTAFDFSFPSDTTFIY
jgi:outer membrane lipoprotein-sorting protein